MFAVVLGAFGAHGLREVLSPRAMAIWHTAVQYQMFHALALLLFGVLSRSMPANATLKRAAQALVGGIILFSGSLYALALSGVSQLGMITPLGGVAFLLGWMLFLIALRDRGSDS